MNIHDVLVNTADRIHDIYLHGNVEEDVNVYEGTLVLILRHGAIKLEWLPKQKKLAFLIWQEDWGLLKTKVPRYEQMGFLRLPNFHHGYDCQIAHTVMAMAHLFVVCATHDALRHHAREMVIAYNVAVEGE